MPCSLPTSSLFLVSGGSRDTAGILHREGWLFPGQSWAKPLLANASIRQKGAAPPLSRPCRGLRRLRTPADRPTSPAATGTVRGAKARRRPATGWPSDRPTSCRSDTSTSSSRCPPRSARSRSRTSGPSTTPVPGSVADHDDDRRRSEATGARIGLTAVLHTWGSAMTHHPPHPHDRARRRPVAGRLALIASRPAFLLPVRARSPVPAPLPRRARRPACRRQARLPRRTCPPRRSPSLRPPSRPESAKRWSSYAKPPFASGGRSGLSLALQHPSPSSSRRGASPPSTAALSLPRQGLPPGRAARHRSLTWRRRVHPPLPSPRQASRLPPHPPLRVFLTGPDRKAGLERIRLILGTPPSLNPPPRHRTSPSRPTSCPPCPCFRRSDALVGIPSLRWSPTAWTAAATRPEPGGIAMNPQCTALNPPETMCSGAQSSVTPCRENASRSVLRPFFAGLDVFAASPTAEHDRHACHPAATAYLPLLRRHSITP